MVALCDRFLGGSQGMPTSGQLDQLVSALESSVANGLVYFEGPGSTSTVKIGRWHAREVLCHLVWWHQATVEGVEAVASGGSPYHIYASTDEMNARAVGRLSGKTVPQMAEMVRQWQTRLAAAIRTFPDLNATVMVRGDGTALSAQQRLETMAQHWNEHVKELQTASAA
jgi:hypothetical protein